MKLRLKQWIYLGLCFLLLASVQLAAAQDTSQATARDISGDEWQQLTSDEAFVYRDQIESDKPKRRQLAIERFIIQLGEFFSGTVGRVIIWGLFFALLGYAVYAIFLSEKTKLFSRREKKAEKTEEQIAEDILETDWEKLLQQAARSGELRNAVRYSYMLLLQLLQSRELIQYRSDKTNYQYLADLSDTPYKQPFRQLSRQYEYTWYGNFPVAPSSYEEYMRLFDHLKKQLGR